MNTVQLIGRLTSDPQITELSDDVVVSKFNIAVDRTMSTEKKEEYISKGKATADFPRIQAWNKQARLVEKYLEKGKMVGIVGELHTDVYENKEGEPVYSTVVNVQTLKFL